LAIASVDLVSKAGRVAISRTIEPRFAPCAATRPVFARSVRRSVGGNMKILNASVAQRIQPTRFRCAAMCAMA